MPFDINSLSTPALAADTTTPWSHYQQDIFFFTERNSGSCLVEAVAGSGKTKTMVEVAVRLALLGDFSILALAFNKSIQVELEKRMPSGITASTFHALGFSLIRKAFGKVTVKSSKTYADIKKYCSGQFHDDNKRDIARLVSLLKNTGYDPDSITADMIRDYLDDYGLDIKTEDIVQAAGVAMACLTAAKENTEEIDFDDMMWFPIIFNLPFPTFDCLLVDEAQDLASIQHEFLDRLTNYGSRVFAFGDTRQAIYGFRGAEAKSMSMLAYHFSMTSLPLSVTYRCPIAVTMEAKAIVPQIEYRDDAPAGVVQHIEKIDWTTLRSEDMVVCRNNRPLFELGMHLLSEGIRCEVKGNFAGALAWFIKNFHTQDIEVLNMRLEAWKTEEVEMAEARGSFGKAGAIEDKYGCIRALMEGANDVQDVLANLNKLTSGGGLVLSSIHKAKGLEADTVVFYKPSLIPASYAHTDSQLEQEENLRYVAITRAKNNLLYMEHNDD